VSTRTAEEKNAGWNAKKQEWQGRVGETRGTWRVINELDGLLQARRPVGAPSTTAIGDRTSAN